MTITPEEHEALEQYRYAQLDHLPSTDVAKALVDAIYTSTEEYERANGLRRKGRRGTAAKLRRAVGALVADLLHGRARDHVRGYVRRSVRRENFTDEHVSYRHFKTAHDAMMGLGLMELVLKGYRKAVDGVTTLLLPSVFRGTPKLLKLAEHHGVTLAEVDRHFGREVPHRVLVLKGRSLGRDGGGNKIKGRPIKFEETPTTIELERQVREINTFLEEFEIGGGEYRGYRRIFNNGDVPGFNWDKGGRLYGYGSDNYQNAPREQRHGMTIDGQTLCELDIRACNLTTFYAWHGESFAPDADPYRVEGLGEDEGAREAAKAFVNTMFGRDEPLTGWPRDTVKEFHEATGEDLRRKFPFDEVRRAVFASLPLLRTWDTDPRGWADLMYVESSVLIRAMLALKDKGIPSLAMHDALLVPATMTVTAQKELEEAYRAVTGVTPTISPKMPPANAREELVGEP